MLTKLAAIEAKYSQIEARLNVPETYDAPELVTSLNREQTELHPLVDNRALKVLWKLNILYYIF